ncbi:hypothetical protein GEV27_07640 [Aeromicrobium sp. S22]|uniref:T3SS (YopN, CesT) and YbjN peptide-binding chaperone 1 n=1 Tax=Aeromicrobium sp. S22 TaxID=2662029 RepID=UPI00129D778F|nr:hypothetical protein [Aeromicrobium sp. S22]MRK01394.1 hypothetical protein [Aeromicrobium sp. S22]
MGSYEEMVVDREVAGAWLTFRVRVADRLADMRVHNVLALGLPDADDGWTVELVVTRRDSRFEALWEWDDEQDRPHARHGRSITFGPGSIDAYARVISDALESAGAVHPSFVEVLAGDLVLADPAEPPAAPAPRTPTPESVSPLDRADLQQWVERAVSERLGFEPPVRDDGSIGLARDAGRVDIRVSRSRPVVEVWAVVARDVDVRKARKRLLKLNGRFHFFCFSLIGDSLVVATTVNADPFCPAHLDRAIDSTFGFLQDEGGRVGAKVIRPRPGTPVALGVDEDLLLLFGLSGDRSDLVIMARDLADDSRRSLRRWRDAAIEAGKLARRRTASTEGALQDALLLQVIAWRKVVSALDDAIGEITDETGAAA